MRRKKHKHTRKAVRFYRINHGFRPPFKVIVDGNFIHALDALKRGDASQQVEHLLGDKVRLFTTKCVMQELRGLGKEFSGTRHICKGFALHHCGHEDAVSAADCLAAQVEGGNAQHFFVATQDRPLQRRVMATEGGANMFVSVNGLHLEAPSEMQRRQAEKDERARMAPGRVERSSRALRELAEPEEGAGAPARAPFKRKTAKGPNPLAMRPKKRAAAGGAGGGGAAAAAGAEGEPAKPKRQRRRRKEGGEGGDGSE